MAHAAAVVSAMSPFRMHLCSITVRKAAAFLFARPVLRHPHVTSPTPAQRTDVQASQPVVQTPLPRPHLKPLHTVVCS